MRRLFCIILVFIFFAGCIQAQVDNTFWFAAPGVNIIHGAGVVNGINYIGGEPVYFRMASLEDPATVTISEPTNPSFVPIIVNIAAGGFASINMTPYVASGQLETKPADSILPYGILIQSTSNITVYYDIQNEYNRDLYPLKGQNALGLEFYTPFENLWNNDPRYGPAPPAGGDARAEFDIVATEDNTQINITPADALENSTYAAVHPAGVTFSITLNKGQVYSCKSASPAAARHLGGSHIVVTNGKKIAVTISDDSVNPYTCADIVGDQMIPVNIIKSQYIIMRGEVFYPPYSVHNAVTDIADGVYTGEDAFICTTQPNTTVYAQEGEDTIILQSNANAGVNFKYNIRYNATYIWATNPIYILHVAGFGCEVGGALLPTIEDCTGSTEVAVYRTNRDEPFFINLMCPKGAEGCFTVYHQNSALQPPQQIPASYFDSVPGTGWMALQYQYKQFSPITNFGIPILNVIPADTDQVTTITNTCNYFHEGIIAGINNKSCSYGYFSAYNQARGGASISQTGSPFLIACNGDTAKFTASGGIQYNWYLMDTATNQKIHDYLSNPYIPNPWAVPPPGVYDFYVDITRPACFGDTTCKIEVIIANPIIANFTTDKVQGCAPLTVTYNNLSVGNNWWNRWNFTEGNTTTTDTTSAITFKQTYQNNTESAINILAQLKVSNTDGCPDSLKRWILVYPAIQAGFGYTPAQGCNDLTVNFTNNTTGDIGSYLWNFGDSSSSYDSVPVHTYYNNTLHNITFQIQQIAITPFDCRDTATGSVTVFPFIEANFAVDTVIGCSPLTIRIQWGSLGKIDTVIWDFGDGNKGSTKGSFYYTYSNLTANTITRHLKLIVKQTDGCSDSLERDITIYPAVNSAFTVPQTVMCSPAMLQFTKSADNLLPDSVLTYNWNFGDSGSSLIKSPSHEFRNLGPDDTTYITRLIVTSTNFCADTSRVPLTVHAEVKANFVIDQASGCAQFPVQITNLSYSAKSIINYNWNFGDGTVFDTSKYNITQHIYQNGTNTSQQFTLRLIVNNASHCMDTFKRSIVVNPQVIANFTVNDSMGCQPLSVSFDASKTLNANEFLWNLGDGVSSSDRTFSHIYSNLSYNDSIYTVTLVATNNTYGCSDTSEINIKVGSLVIADFQTQQSNGCSPLVVNINNSSQNWNGLTVQSWNFGDGIIDTLFLTDFTHTYIDTTLAVINRTINLIVENNMNCRDSLSRTITVYPEIRAGFTPKPLSGCQPLIVQFTNTSNQPVAQNFNWVFGDGGTSAEVNPSDTFRNLTNTDTVFTVRLLATSLQQCEADTSVHITVYAYIHADFKVPEANQCSGSEFNFINASLGGISQYSWDFYGDGTTDLLTPDAVNVEHTYTNLTSDNLVYNVTLVVNNNHACFDSITSPVTIYPQVTAGFSMDSTGCTPDTVLFINNSINSDYWNWYFGNQGNTSSSANPTYLFINNTDIDITIPVQLIASSRNQCSDTITKTEYIYYRPKAIIESNAGLSNVCPPYTAIYNNESVASTATFYWNFGDSTGVITNTKDSVTHVFQNNQNTDRIFNIYLTAVSDYGCRDSTYTSLNVHPEVIAAFTVDTDFCSGISVEFHNQSERAIYYNWNFDDGTGMHLMSDTVPFPYLFTNLDSINKIFHVGLSVISQFGCSDSTYRNITVYPVPIPVFMPDSFYRIFPRNTFGFTNKTNPGPFTFDWYFGDGDTSIIQTTTFSHTYSSWGSYQVFLHAESNHCQATSPPVVLTIAPPNPVALFDSSVSGCPPITIQFINLSKWGVKYTWIFDNGQSSYDSIPPVQVYTKPGSHPVTLEVVGQPNTLPSSLTNWITVYDSAIASFNLSDTSDLMLSDNSTAIVSCYNTSTPPVNSRYLWDFFKAPVNPENIIGTSAEVNPQYTFMVIGSYFIVLKMWTNDNCVDSTYVGPIIVGSTGIVKFPNAFAPDLSGSNGGAYNQYAPNDEVFYPYHEGIASEGYRLEIYDRWGELIFVSENVYVGWDGYYKGQLCKQDVYVYKAKGNFLNGKDFTKVGNVTLLHINK